MPKTRTMTGNIPKSPSPLVTNKNGKSRRLSMNQSMMQIFEESEPENSVDEIEPSIVQFSK